MSLKKTFNLKVAKMKLVGGLLTVAMVFGIGVMPNKAVAATDAEIIAMIQSILNVIQQIRNQINNQAGVPNAGEALVDKFPDPVIMGSTNDSILLLQRILATDSSIYPSGLTTGTFGDLTEEGLRKFQTKFYLPVTGTFTLETEYVLNSVLSAIPLPTTPQNYLNSSTVIDGINSAADTYLLANTTINGKVAFRPLPIFSSSVKSSDTAILQRIMKTDTQIFRGEVSGLMDIATIAGIIKLRDRYSAPYIQAQNSPVVLSELMNTQTLSILNRILTANNSGEIKAGLLGDASVAPATLMTNTERTIQSVKAVKNYLLEETKVTVIYVGKTSEKLVVPLIKPEANVINAIANKLNRPVADINGKVTFSAIYDKLITKIVLTLKPANKKEIDIDFTYRDETTEFRTTTEAEANQGIDLYFNGNEEQFLTAMDGYIQDARQGIVSNDLIEFVSDITGVDDDEIRNVSSIKVEEEPGFDPFGGGG